jgi:predicted transcriptional regulator of viral defense system
MKSSEGERNLFELAQEQGGYFTAKQAAGLGYVASKRNYHVGVGNWIREHRGIFRLSLYPPPDRPDLILWWLWSRGRSDSPVGVFSHHTALSLHELTDVNPAKLDLTVPPGFRRGTAIPSILRLHVAEVGTDERENVSGVPVTNALRTIIDIWREGTLPKPILSEAFTEALRQGKLTKRQVAQAKKNPAMAWILDAIETGSK